MKIGFKIRFSKHVHSHKNTCNKTVCTHAESTHPDTNTSSHHTYKPLVLLPSSFFLPSFLCVTKIMQLCVCVRCIQEERVGPVCWPSVTATQKAQAQW